MSLNYRAFQPGLSPSVMAYSQPALWSWLLFLIAGFKNNCPAPFKKRQLGNDLAQKAYLSVTELGNDQDLFACQVTTVSVIISTGWRGWQCTQGCRVGAQGVPIPGPALAHPWWGMPWAGVEQQGWRLGAVTDIAERQCLLEWFWEGAFLEMHSWKPCKRVMKRLGKAALSCVNAAGVFLGCCLTALFYLREMPAVWIWGEVHWRWRKG